MTRGGRSRGTYWLAMALATAAAIAWAAPAGAATIPTQVEIGGYGYDLDLRSASGQIESPRSACLANRKVSLLAKAGPRFEPFSADVSSDNGFFGGEGTQADGPPTKFKVVVRRKRLGPNRTCSGASDSESTPSGPGGRLRATFPTSVGIFGASIGDTVFADGRITARKSCRKNRRVRIIALRDEGNLTVDADRASDNGFFGGGGPAPSSEGVRALAPEKAVGDDVCAAGSDDVTAP